MDNKQILQEIMGTFVPNRTVGPPPILPGQADLRTKNYDTRNIGLNLSYCNQLESWQRNIVDTLAGQGGATASDQYIIARPGGGKTLPIICYWTQHILGLNTMALQNQNITRGISILFSPPQVNARARTPRIIFLVPVIVLAHQTAMEIRKYIATLMMQVYNYVPDLILNDLVHRQYGQFRIAQYRQEVTNLTAQVSALEALPYGNRDRNAMPRVQDALNSARKNLTLAVENCMAHIVNEMVWTQTAQTNQQTDFNRALVFVSIYESAPKLVKRIQNLSLTVIDEAHLIQESGIENDDNQRAYQIMGSLFSILKTLREVPNNRIAMLSGTINPSSARNITGYFNECFGRNFSLPTSAPVEAANRSNLAIIANDNLNSMDGVLKYIIRNVSQRDWGQLYVIFSTSQIVQLAKECVEKLGIKNAENMSPSGYEPSNVFSGLGSARQNKNDLNLGDSSTNKISIPRDMMLLVSNITNPLLRQCVLRGVGFICRSVPGESFVSKESNLNDQDKLIVSKLFRERKISVLLATDAVGIGVNIDVKDLYIPKVQKFNAAIGTNAFVSLRDLSQILNRAGRGATPIASIQTSKDNVEMVSNALYSNPEDLPDVSELRKRGSINPCNSKSFMNLWRSLFGDPHRNNP